MKKVVNILLVEDNEGDVLLTLEALKEVKINNVTNVVNDGDKAIKYLNKEGVYKNVETPSLILLDINLPKIDGREVLTYIKNDEVLKVIPVVMLTTSNAQKDIIESYQNYANCFITKPSDYKNFIGMIHAVNNFWMDIAELPYKINA